MKNDYKTTHETAFATELADGQFALESSVQEQAFVDEDRLSVDDIATLPPEALENVLRKTPSVMEFRSAVDNLEDRLVSEVQQLRKLLLETSNRQGEQTGVREVKQVVVAMSERLETVNSEIQTGFRSLTRKVNELDRSFGTLKQDIEKSTRSYVDTYLANYLKDTDKKPSLQKAVSNRDMQSLPTTIPPPLTGKRK